MEGNIWHFVVFVGEPESAISAMSPVLPANICQVELFCLSAITVGWHCLTSSVLKLENLSGNCIFLTTRKPMGQFPNSVEHECSRSEHAGPQERCH